MRHALKRQAERPPESAPPPPHHIESGALRLDYQVGAERAQAVADLLAQRFPELTVTVDDNIHDDLPPLPCA